MTKEKMAKIRSIDELKPLLGEILNRLDEIEDSDKKETIWSLILNRRLNKIKIIPLKKPI